MCNAIVKFLNRVKRVGGQYAYRGQADERWALHSSAVRRLVNDAGSYQTRDARFVRTYQSYHRDELIGPARTAGFDIEDGRIVPDLQLLAKLQHFGAATGLLDFTWNPLIALWFACESVKDDERNGKVFVVNLNDQTNFERVSSHELSVEQIFGTLGERRPLYYEPIVRSEASARIIGQRSVFVIGRPLISDDLVECIEIDASDKPRIRRELADSFDISGTSLFRDIHGFSTINRGDSPIRFMDDPEYYAFRGNRYYQEGDYSVAIANYDRCIELALGVREFYLLRANARSAKEDYAGALSDYGVSEECSRLYYGMAPGATLVRDLGRALIAFNRGNIKAAMKDYEGAVAEYDEAIAREAENEERGWRGVLQQR